MRVQAIAALLLVPGLAAAELSVDVGLGFRGHGRIGEWTAVRVDVSNTGAATELLVRISGPDADSVRRIQAPGGSRQRFWIPVRAMRTHACTVTREGRLIFKEDLKLEVVSSRTRYVLVLADTPLGLPAEKDWACVVADPHDLPDFSDAYQAFDAVVVRFPGTSWPADALGAVRRWTLAGGRLVVCAGAEASAAAASPLGDLLPAVAQGVDEIESLDRLFEAALPSPEGTFPVARLAPRAGAEARPFGAEGPAGAGTCTWVAFDPLMKPISGWSGLAAWWKARLVVEKKGPEGAAEKEERDRRERRVAARKSAADLALSGRNVTMNWYFGLLVAYLVVIGPLEFFVLRGLKRMPWTWVTMPATVAAFCLAMWMFSKRDPDRGPTLTVVGVVDVRPGAVRETAVLSVVVPRAGVHAIALDAPDARVWPAERDRDPWRLEVETDRPEADCGARPGLRGIQAAAWMPWIATMTADLPGTALEARRLGAKIVLHAPATLRRCVLHTPEGDVPLGDIAPGEEIPVFGAQPREGSAPGEFERDAEELLRRLAREDAWVFAAPAEPAGRWVSGWLDRPLSAPSLDGRPAYRAALLVRIHLGEAP